MSDHRNRTRIGRPSNVSSAMNVPMPAAKPPTTGGSRRVGVRPSSHQVDLVRGRVKRSQRDRPVGTDWQLEDVVVDVAGAIESGQAVEVPSPWRSSPPPGVALQLGPESLLGHVRVARRERELRIALEGRIVPDLGRGGTVGEAQLDARTVRDDDPRQRLDVRVIEDRAARGDQEPLAVQPLEERQARVVAAAVMGELDRRDRDPSARGEQYDPGRP